MRHLRIILGIGVSLVFLVLLLRQVDLHDLMDALKGVSPAWITISLLLFGASVWARAQRWAVILRPIAPLSQTEASSLMTIGLAANNVLPARTGEIVRAVLLKRQRGISGFAVLATILVERILDGLVLAMFLAVTIALAGGTTLLQVLAAICGTGFMALTMLIALFATRPAVASRLIAVLVRGVPSKHHGRVEGWAERFLSGLAPMRTPGAWFAALSLTSLSWGLEALSCWAVGQAFGLGLDIGIYFGVCGAANLSMVLPSTSGGIGPYEYVTREVVGRFGVPAATGTAYALVLHATILVPVAIIGLLLIWRQDLGLKTLTPDADEITEGEPEPGTPGTSGLGSSEAARIAEPSKVDA